jgi:hypothetical protein
MAEKAVVYLEVQPVVTVDGEGVKIVYQSGGETYVRRCTRAFFRKHCETSLRKLNAYEEAERAKPKVVRMRKPGH